MQLMETAEEMHSWILTKPPHKVWTAVRILGTLKDQKFKNLAMHYALESTDCTSILMILYYTIKIEKQAGVAIARELLTSEHEEVVAYAKEMIDEYA